MKIAVLDDGINEKYIQTPVQHLFINSIASFPVDNTSHGTICAKIIETYGEAELIYDIRVIDSNHKGKIDYLIEALSFCKKLDIDIINLSIGIEDYVIGSPEYHQLYLVCYHLFKRGVKIYAAQGNLGMRTIPADFHCVNSVEDICELFKVTHLFYRASDYYAFSHHILFLHKLMFSERCNSYACAYVSAMMTRNQNTSKHRYYIKNRHQVSHSYYYYIKKIKKQSIPSHKRIPSIPYKLLSIIPNFNLIWTHTPIIYITSSTYNKYTNDLGVSLRYRFQNEGYRTLLLSSYYKSVYNDIDFVKSRFSYLVHLFQKRDRADLIILICPDIHVADRRDYIIRTKGKWIMFKDTLLQINQTTIKQVMESAIQFFNKDD